MSRSILSPLLITISLLGGIAPAAEEPGIRLAPTDDAATIVAKAASVRPTARQVAWQRREFSAFIHFGMNTFTGREWGDGTEDPALFNPTDLDARQWVAACKAAGMSTVILTAKHHDGFCLWQTAHTRHSVASSPWKNGTGDVVQEFADACREQGMGLGLYVSPWDRHEPSYGDSPRYNAYFLAQLRELLTRHPEVVEVWFDGACGEGPNGRRQVYDWRAYWDLIRELAPAAAISVRGPDVRWCGNEAGRSRAAEWSVLPLAGADAGPWTTSDATLTAYDRDIYGEDLGSRAALTRAAQDGARVVWYPSQVNTSIRPGWFYHAGEDGAVRSLGNLVELYYGAVGGNGQFLLNLPPDRRGRLHETDVSRLHQLGDVLRRTFGRNLAQEAQVTASVTGGRAVGDARSLVRGDPDHCWTTTDHPASVALTLSLPRPTTFNVVALQEHLPSGQRVEGVEVAVKTRDGWQTLGQAPVIGHRRLLRVADVTATEVLIRLQGWRVRPTLASLGLYQAPALLTPPTITRGRNGDVTITPVLGTRARYTLDGREPEASSPVAEGPVSLPLGGTVTARSEALTAGNALDLGGAATNRRVFGLATAGWTVTADSEDPRHGTASHAVDDDPSTFWHSAYREGTTPLPHHLTIDLGRAVTVAALTYLPRQDQWQGGIAQRVAVAVQAPGSTEWRTVVEDQALDNVVNSRALQTIRLPQPTACQAVRLIILANHAGDHHASAAEVGVIPAGVP